jgi:PAS domain S-box-containing protein
VTSSVTDGRAGFDAPAADALARAEQRAAELETELAARTLELARSEDKYRELFDASPDLYFVVDARGRIAEVNRTALRATGYRHEELLGRRAPKLVAPEARRRLWAALPGFVETGRVENLELTIRRRDGSPIETIISASAVRDELGHLIGAHAVLRDVTSRLALQRQLLQADRLVATGRLAAGVAHEINNPLQAIMLHLALIEAALPENFAEREAFERVREGVRRIRQIVAALLDLHRGGDQLLQPVDVHAVLEEALGLAQTPLRHGNVRVQRDLAPELPRVWAVERHVYQVLLNLILNALDAMRDGGQLTVRTRFLLAAGEIEIDIGDTGPGIAENLLPQIFDPFFTGGDRSRTGLGLFITYGLVRQHGGRLQVDSQPGRGTTFRVFFPALDEAGAGDRGPAIEPQAGEPPP